MNLTFDICRCKFFNNSYNPFITFHLIFDISYSLFAYLQIQLFLTAFGLTLFVSTLLVLAFELPIIHLEKAAFNTSKKATITKSPDEQDTTNENNAIKVISLE